MTRSPRHWPIASCQCPTEQDTLRYPLSMFWKVRNVSVAWEGPNRCLVLMLFLIDWFWWQCCNFSPSVFTLMFRMMTGNGRGNVFSAVFQLESDEKIVGRLAFWVYRLRNWVTVWESMSKQLLKRCPVTRERKLKCSQINLIPYTEHSEMRVYESAPSLIPVTYYKWRKRCIKHYKWWWCCQHGECFSAFISHCLVAVEIKQGIIE